MLYVKIELWPGGDEKRKQTLAEGKIWNVSQLADISNYSYSLSGKKGSHMGQGTVFGFPRKRLMAWDLLYRVLRDARHRFNPDKVVDKL